MTAPDPLSNSETFLFGLRRSYVVSNDVNGEWPSSSSVGVEKSGAVGSGGGASDGCGVRSGMRMMSSRSVSNRSRPIPRKTSESAVRVQLR